jgi:glycosyltransferase involved in cell wall biosynthesis
MLGTHHSWAVVMRNLLHQFRLKKHNLYLTTTNGESYIPSDLRKHLGKECIRPDIDICYTLPRNFHSRFRKKSKCKMVIYNYETSHMPAMWKDRINFVDYALPSSNFSKEVFVNSGWPEEKCIVVPHGINIEEYNDKSKVKLFNNKSFRFLNVSIAHYRKNIDLLVDAYYSAFSEDDDVCLVIKTSLKMPNRRPFKFECNIAQQIKEVQEKYLKKGHKLPQVEIVQNKLESMIPLYNSCDVLVSAASSEGFGMPLLEGLAADMLVVAPRCTGQLDFLNDKNSLLVNVKTIDAGLKYQYWRPTKGATTYLPIKDDLADAMQKAYRNKDKLKKEFNLGRKETLGEFSWENAANKILELV